MGPDATPISGVAACVGGNAADRIVYEQRTKPVAAGATESKTTRCQAGYKVSGGGAIVQGTFPGGDLKVSAPTPAGRRLARPCEGMARRGRGRQGVHTARATPARR